MVEPIVYGELDPCGGGDPIPLLKRKLIVGRRSSCDITLRFANVSSHHCELELLNGYWHVRDLGSSNGIKVNGERCDQKFLFPGDTLQVARHRYEIRYQALGERPIDEVTENPFGQSLLEKAGLAASDSRRRRKSEVVPRASDPDDDIALKYLMGDH